MFEYGQFLAFKSIETSFCKADCRSTAGKLFLTKERKQAVSFCPSERSPELILRNNFWNSIEKNLNDMAAELLQAMSGKGPRQSEPG